MAGLRDRLPFARDAELHADTPAGRQFRSALIRQWTRLSTGEAVRGEGGADTVARASLVRRVQIDAQPYLRGEATPGSREPWRRVHASMSAWWRPHTDEDGAVCVRLAQRWDLGGQVGVELPEVTDQDSLTILGTKFGVLADPPDVPHRLSGGGRLAVLAPWVVTELFAEPDVPGPETTGE